MTNVQGERGEACKVAPVSCLPLRKGRYSHTINDTCLQNRIRSVKTRPDRDLEISKTFGFGILRECKIGFINVNSE